jgi:hypothetical protein
VKRESLGGPIALILIGAFFLLRKWIPDFHPFDLLREWWPAMLIVIGAVMLAQRLTAGSRAR